VPPNLSRIPLLATLLLSAVFVAGQQTPQVTLDTSETLFTVLTAMNACGYDQELSVSDPVRAQVRAQVVQAVGKSDGARSAMEAMCEFYRDHRQASAARDLAQYVSLALNLGPPPAFAPATSESDLPPDAGYVLGMAAHLQRFYPAAGLHQIWESHGAEYHGMVARFHDPVAKMLLDTEAYLRVPLGSSPHRLAVFLEPMAAPSQVNARSYDADYSLVMSPGHAGLRLETIRHTYLHRLLDPMAERRRLAIEALEPLMEYVRTAPVDDSFRNDVALIYTESLIRAIEARLDVPGRSKAAEAERSRRAERAAEAGFLLAPYFNEQLAEFEKAETSLALAYGDWLHDLDLSREKKRASHLQFVAESPEENVHAAAPRPGLLREAEARLAAGDLKGARELAQKALDQKREDPARVLFLLARISTASRDMSGASDYFQRTLEVAHEPRLVAWSHIYLGRICDLKDERQQALEHYRAALAAGDVDAATRAAAERGLQQPYEPPQAAGREHD
jgi:hypothetical protein